jgi:hypothetical protein
MASLIMGFSLDFSNGWKTIFQGLDEWKNYVSFVVMKWLCVLFSLLLTVQAFAWGRQKERTWYVKGKAIKATQYAVNGDKVHLYTLEDWPEPTVVFIRDLSHADREYIKTCKEAVKQQETHPTVCPMLDVKASVNIGMATSAGQEVTVVSNVQSPGGNPCGGKVFMKVLLVGKVPGSSHYTLVGLKEFPFRLPVGKPLEMEFNFNLRAPNGSRSAPTYAGYLVAVSDENGRRVALKSYPGSLAQNAEKLFAMSAGDRFDQRFNPVP